MKKLLMVLCMLLPLCVTACAPPPATQTTVATLPPAVTEYTAPVGDAAMLYTAEATLFLPSRDGQRLLAVRSPVELNHSRHGAEAIVRALLAHPGTADASPVGGGVSIALYGQSPVEVSGGVCTVNLSSAALQLEDEPFYTLCMALTSTLCRLPDILYVNVLVAGQAVGLDVADLLPCGSLTPQPGGVLPDLWTQISRRRAPLGTDPAQAAVSATATLYFPMLDGSGVATETRSLTFAGQTPEQQVQTLLDALNAGPVQLAGTAVFPDLAQLMTAQPSVTELTDGGRVAMLSFRADLDAQLRALGVDTACFVAAVTDTLTTFIPSVSAVQFLLGGAALTSVYSRAHGSLLFEQGLIRRTSFAPYLMTPVPLVLPAEAGLQAKLRPVPGREARNPRYLLGLLMAGPTEEERSSGLQSPLPAGLGDADVLGIALQGDTLLVNFSQRAAETFRTLDGGQEQATCYSLVNTLCAAVGARRICFFFGGEQVQQLAGTICWGGEFLYSPEMIK